MDDGGKKPIGAGPRTRVCYVCGRQYGLTSFDIHLKQCKDLFLKREAQKDPRDRKQLPRDPMQDPVAEAPLRGGGGGGGRPSSSSGRGGDETMSGGGLSLEEINKRSSEAFNNEVMESCKFCGRTFLAEKLGIHNKSCTVDKPARRVNDAVNRRGGAPAVSDATPTPYKPPKSRGSSTGYEGMAESDVYGNGDKGDTDQSNNLRVHNGELVGHIGGKSGRPLRTSPIKQRPSSRASAERPSADSTAYDRQAVVEQLTDKLEVMENVVFELSQSIQEMKTALSKLQ